MQHAQFYPVILAVADNIFSEGLVRTVLIELLSLPVTVPVSVPKPALNARTILDDTI
jgi:hypothetical protein